MLQGKVKDLRRENSAAPKSLSQAISELILVPDGVKKDALHAAADSVVQHVLTNVFVDGMERSDSAVAIVLQEIIEGFIALCLRSVDCLCNA